MTTPSTATLHEAAGRIGALPSAIKPVHLTFKVAGPAYPVRCPAGDNLQLHRAVYAAEPGDVLVVDVGDGIDFGYWGEILSVAARTRELGGLVIHGCVRDRDQLATIGFPVFAAGVCIRGTVKDRPGGAIGEDITVGDVTVSRGDLVVGDSDGVVVIPAADADRVIEAGLARDDAEAKIMERLRAGGRTLDLLDLPSPNPEQPAATTPAPARTPIAVPGLAHAGAPFPVATRVGPLFQTSALHGRNPSTGELADTLQEQAIGVFDNVRRVLDAAGITAQHVVKVEVFAEDPAAARSAMSEPWQALFPDPDNRPVRHTTTAPLPAGFLIQAEVTAFIEEAAR